MPTNEFDTYSEVPLTKRSALIVKTLSRSYEQDEAESVDVALKRSIFRSRGFAVSAQGALHWTDAPEMGCSRVGGEMRGLVGLSSRRTFANVELAARGAQGGCAHLRLETTAGYRPSHQWLLLAQTFADQDLAFDEVVKGQISVVRFSRTGRGLQFGVRAQYERGEFMAPTLILGYWSRPR